MIDAMLIEMEQKKDYLNSSPISSLYFGGGTPSILSSEAIDRLLFGISKYYSLEPAIEITLEANPDDLSMGTLKALKTSGINRLSIGLQSFYDEELKWMNRAHSAEQSFACITHANQVGFDNISVDLIYGSHFLSDEKWLNQLSIIEKMPIQHLSCYALTVEDKTALAHAIKSKLLNDLDDAKQERQFKLLQDWSIKAGFDHYEISNLAKKNKYSKHNSAYWANAPYLGIGPSAHSYDNNTRQWNISNNAVYMKLVKDGEGYFEKEILSEKDNYNELILTQLRTSLGLNKNQIYDRFNVSIQRHFEKELQRQIRLKTIVDDNNILHIPNKNWFKADGIASELFLIENS